jgi:hypothetical protein
MQFATQIAWSPSDNYLIAGDYCGAFYRWRKAIPDGHPPPVKTAAAAATASTSRAPPQRSLFDDAAPAVDDVPLPVDGDDIDADNFEDLDPIDWIDNDLGAEEVEEVGTGTAGGFVKEMGASRVSYAPALLLTGR